MGGGGIYVVTIFGGVALEGQPLDVVWGSSVFKGGVCRGCGSGIFYYVSRLRPRAVVRRQLQEVGLLVGMAWGRTLRCGSSKAVSSVDAPQWGVGTVGRHVRAAAQDVV